MSYVNTTVILISLIGQEPSMGQGKYFGIYANKSEILQQVKTV